MKMTTAITGETSVNHFSVDEAVKLWMRWVILETTVDVDWYMCWPITDRSVSVFMVLQGGWHYSSTIWPSLCLFKNEFFAVQLTLRSQTAADVCWVQQGRQQQSCSTVQQESHLTYYEMRVRTVDWQDDSGEFGERLRHLFGYIYAIWRTCPDNADGG